MTASNFRTFVAYVEDKPGVLNRVASLFRRRGYNIISLNVGRTHEGDEIVAHLIEANLYKLVNILSVEDITDQACVVRDLALIKVSVGPDRRNEVLQLVEVFRARVVDIGPESLVAEISGSPDKIEAMVGCLAPFGILEMVQTGQVAMTRGTESSAARVAHGQNQDSVVTAA
jgi:acetolactate synthase-1/3 small subunit